MLAVQFNEFGNPPDVLHTVELPQDIPGPGEVVVTIEATPIHPSDLLTISGSYGIKPALPATPGQEGVGRVAEVGEGVNTLKTGDLVLLPLGAGTWRSHIKLSANTLVPLPQNGDPVQYSLMSINPLTASLLLSEIVALQPGDWVIQNAANSSVGHYLVALAKQRGIKTLNLVRRGGGVDRQIRELGGTEVIVDKGQDLRKEVKAITGGDPVRLGIDAIGGEATATLAGCLSPGATLVNYGALSGAPCQIQPGTLIFHDIRLQGFWLVNWLRDTPAEQVRTQLMQLAPDIANGRLHAEIGGSYPLERIKDATQHAMQGSRDGKVILTPESHW
ncbi:MAG: zinc-dependent alcohol dehydrogenase family protein [Salinisphaeraceae bacterium]|nr:zinc-dependent alcohol dehydrogenase family protein [Salinisphaeraceae bacterium]